jgi:murein L,D-transpeptidase YcbB/YkuD
LILVLVAPLTLNSQQDEADSCKSELCDLIISGNLPDLRWPDFSDYKDRIRAFYEPASYTFAWSERAALTEPTKSIIEVLRNAGQEGLDPEDYDGPRWGDRLKALSPAGRSPSESDLARFDLALTISVMRYISDLHFGKVNPGLYHTDFDIGGSDHDLPQFVRQHLVNATDVKAAFDGVEPPYEGYRRTQQAMRRYAAIARQDNPSLPPVAKKPVEPGSSYAAAAQLANLLRRLGDLPPDAPPPPDPNTYSGALVSAVKHFQARHGLDPDGRLGKATLAQLNTPLSYRVRQLQLSLERWRWIPHGFLRPPIVVNIPEFQLRALDESYKSELTMKVVVGKAYHHETPIFAAEMTHLVFRPHWDVPLSIQRAELVPKLERDRSYLTKHGYELVTPQASLAGEGMADDAILTQLRSGKLRVRQIPGPENALGLVKFVFPNPYDVYLHATPATELFANSRRDFSHGCIRVEKPKELAAWVLRDKPEWTAERILDAMDGEQPLQVSLDRPVPVLIVYATAVVVENGDVHFFDDLYGQDAELERILEKGYPYSPWKPTSGVRGQGPRE